MIFLEYKDERYFFLACVGSLRVLEIPTKLANYFLEKNFKKHLVIVLKFSLTD